MPIDIAPAQAARTFRVSGELDLLTADELREQMDRASRGHGDVTLDVSGLRFVDSTGVRALLRAAEGLADRGRLVLRSPSRQVQVVLSLMGVLRDGSGLVVEGARDPEWGKAEVQVFPAERAQLPRIRAFIRGRAVEDSFAEWLDAIVLAVSEAAANAVLHSGTQQIEISWRPFADHVDVTVRDDGVFRSVPPDVGGTGNRGLMLMLSLMDQVAISCGTDVRPGTVVRMTKYRDGRTTSGAIGWPDDRSAAFGARVAS